MKRLAVLVLTALTALAALAPSHATAAAKNPKGVAVIIGNKTYSHERVPTVAYAHRDADAFKRYVLDVLGFDPANLIDLRDASQAETVSAFGSRDDHRGKIWQFLDPKGRSDVVVFYSGHGVPGLRTRRGYLLPADADPDTAELNGYPIDVLYRNLGKLELARSIAVFLDACFSGDSHQGMLVRAASPVFVKAALPTAAKGLTVLTAASGDQVASWDEKAGHGLFTQHLLDALYGQADKNGDGRITAAETKDYLDEHMTAAARRHYRRVQNASLSGSADSVLAAAGAGGFAQRPELGEPKVAAADPMPAPPARAPAPAPAATVELEPIDAEYVTIKNANVRDAPSVRGAKVATLPKGTKVAVLGKVKDADWYAVEMKNGRQAFIYKSLLAESAAAPRQVAAIDSKDGKSIVLDSGLTLADWALLAEKRTDSTALLVEASGYRRKFGDVPEVVAVLDKALAAELKRVTGTVSKDPQAALARLARLEDTAGARPPILLLRARALHGKEDYGAAAKAYGQWLRQAPQSHPERQKVAVGLFKAQKRQPLGPVVGDVSRDCDECPEMVVVPAGSFTMGSPKREDGRDSDKGSQRRVTIPAPFAVGRFEVTFDEWDACVRDRGCDDSGPQGAGGDNSWGRGRRPVIEVSWDDAKTYVAWLSRKTGEPYRLLSEAEWEYVARAGTTTRYHWGDAVGSGNANCDGCGSQWDNKKTASVGSFSPNAFGVQDMHGNVWEWVEDCWHGSYSGAPSDGSAWTSGGDCSLRVLRGGSWDYRPRVLRSAYRLRIDSGSRDNNSGFRVARTLR